MSKLIASIVLAFFLGACIKQIDETADWDAAKFYQVSHEQMEDNNWPGAIESFEKLQSRFPYSSEAKQAEIEAIYAYYKYDEHDSAISAASEFINQNPDHARLDYVYYLRAITQYNSSNNTLGKLFPQDIAYRDTLSNKKAFDYFSDLVKRFPESIYRKDSLLRMNYLYNKLAEHELHIARFYAKRKAFVATINRCKKVISIFPNTSASIEALHLLKESYTALGMFDHAKRYQTIIAKNKVERYTPIVRKNPPEILEGLTQ